MSVVIDNAYLIRDGTQPLHVQIRNAIELSIFSGDVPNGSPLPSVRQLSEALNVAPNTVARAYHDLRDEEWINVVPKRGYFVQIEEQTRNATDTQLAVLIDSLLDSATELGVSETTLLQNIGERIRQRRNRVRRVVVVGDSRIHLSGRVEIIRDSTSDLNVEVFGITYQDLEHPSATSGQLADADFVLVPVGEMPIARKFLGEKLSRVIPMTRTLREDVRKFLIAQPIDIQFGIIASSPEVLSRAVGIIKQQHPLLVPPLTASVTEAEQVQFVIENADVLAISWRARSEMPPLEHLEIPAIELIMVPDEPTIRKLRSRLRGEA